MTVNGLQDTEQYCYFAHSRPWPISTRRELEMVIHLDARFVAEQAAGGKSTKDLECLIARFQHNEEIEICWNEEADRREEQAKADKLRMKAESDQRFAKAVASAVETTLQSMLRDIISSGVLRGR